MTIWTNWYQVFSWVNSSFAVRLRKRVQMVNVNEAFAEALVISFKIKFANLAFIAVVIQASLAGFGITFNPPDRHTCPSSFQINFDLIATRMNWFKVIDRNSIPITIIKF